MRAHFRAAHFNAYRHFGAAALRCNRTSVQPHFGGCAFQCPALRCSHTWVVFITLRCGHPPVSPLLCASSLRCRRTLVGYTSVRHSPVSVVPQGGVKKLRFFNMYWWYQGKMFFFSIKFKSQRRYWISRFCRIAQIKCYKRQKNTKKPSWLGVPLSEFFRKWDSAKIWSIKIH